MADHVSPDKLRNVAVLGHRGCGKTSLVEAMLFAAGATTRRGSVAAGTTVADHDEEERRRGFSISAALVNARWSGVKLNIVDTPGEPSFHADTLSVLPAVDCALMVVNAPAGIEVQTRRLWNRLEEASLPRAVVVNMLDRERADADACVAALRELDAGCVPLQIPVGAEADLRGVVNLVSMTATMCTPGGARGVTGPIPDEIAAEAEMAREALVEAVAENDDELIERYLSGEQVTTDDLVRAIRAGVREARMFPVVCASAELGVGVDPLLDLLVEAMPSPAEAMPRIAQGDDGPVSLPARADGHAVAYCFKTLADPFSGRINLLRVFTGVLPADTSVHDADGTKERVGQLFTLQGREHQAMPAIGPGDIGAVGKLKEVATGHVIVTGGPVPRMERPALPPAVMSFAVTARAKADEDKMHASLRRLCDEDPTLDVHRDEQTGELIVGGLSQLHVEVVTERLERRFGVAVDLHPPRVPYRETITATAEAEGKHKKQTGGRGQFADCWLRVEPLPRGAGFEFADRIVGGAIPRTYIPAVEKGVREAMERGGLGGYPVVDVRVTVYDGKHHPVDSSEMAFKIAGGLGMRAALERARPVLLEPIMNVSVTVPTECVGDVMGDLSGRRGHPAGMESVGDMEVVRAEVPMAEMLSYAIDLRAMTGGRGEYAMEFGRYEEVPAHLVQRAVEAVAV